MRYIDIAFFIGVCIVFSGVVLILYDISQPSDVYIENIVIDDDKHVVVSLNVGGKPMRFSMIKIEDAWIMGGTDTGLLQMETPITNLYVPYIDADANYKQFYTNTKYPDEVDESIAIINYMWRNNISLGTPSSMEFYTYNVSTQLDLLYDGSEGVMCKHIAEIFDGFVNQSDTIQHVNHICGYQCYPEFDSVYCNSHAICEVYVASLNKFVAVDPMFGLIFEYNGALLGIDEIYAISRHSWKDINKIQISTKTMQWEDSNPYDLTYEYYSRFNTYSKTKIK